MTKSVGINSEGRIRLRQIIKDSLKPRDSVEEEIEVLVLLV